MEPTEQISAEKLPLLACLKEISRKEHYSFHTPGHAGGRGFGLAKIEDLLSLDSTELSFTADLLEPRPAGPVEKAEDLAAALWSVKKAIFLQQGATLGLQALLYAYVGKQGKLLVLGPVHKSLLQAAYLLDIEISALKTQLAGEASGLILPSTAQRAELATYLAPLAPQERPQAVFLTTPNYYGGLAETKSLHQLCQAYDLPLLVDAAHFAHYPLLKELKPSFDSAVISTHKTCVALTGSALLLCNDEKNLPALRAGVGLFSSTSPSFLIAASTDYARYHVETAGPEILAAWLAAKEEFQENLPAEITLYEPLENFRSDPLRLVLDVSALGPAPLVQAELVKLGLVAEMADLQYLVFILSLGQDPQSLRVLLEALVKLSRKARILWPDYEQDDLLAMVRLWQKEQAKAPLSLDLARHRSGSWQPLERASGLSLATEIVPYPPGIVLYPRGTVLSKTQISLLSAFADYGLSVRGMRQGSQTVEVFCQGDVDD